MVIGLHPVSNVRRAKADLQVLVQAQRQAVLVVNTRARRGQRLYAHARNLLTDKGLTLTATYPVRDPARLPEIVAEAVAQAGPLVIVGGGDGTISSVVDFFAYRDAVLGVLPLGTANSFARTLGIPLDLEGAVDVIASGKVADVDLGRINDDLFANAAAIGMSAAIGRSRPQRLKRYLGRAGYLVAAARTLAAHQPFACRLKGEDGSLVEIKEALDVLIANGPYHGGVLVADEADLESRDLVIRVIKGRSRYALVRAWARIWAGLPLGPADLAVVRTRDVTLETEPRRYVSIDGEVVTQTPIRISVARQALRIMAPQSFKDC